MENQQRQVAEAALAMVRPTTDAKTRTAASQFLEQWTRTPEAWDVYVVWLRSFSNNNANDQESIGMQLLCLQLLQAKIRREVPRGATLDPRLSAIQSEVASFLSNGSANASVVSSACICTAALAVRCGGLHELIQTCQAHSSVSPQTALRLVSNVPLEMEACADLTTPQVTAELFPFLEPVLDILKKALLDPENTIVATEALKNWTKCCHIPLSHLNRQAFEGDESVLSVLVRLLSHNQFAEEQILVQASQTLTEAILVPTDSCTDGRKAAYQMMIHAIPHGFVVAPLLAASKAEWEDACVALGVLISTLVTEEADEIVSQPAEYLLHLLLQIQNHSLPKVRMTALECWLTVQEIPTANRHENWKAPLFRQVIEGLLAQISYPSHFRDWANEFEVDQSEFEEFRRMVKDVFISAYFLLRIEFVQSMASQILTSQDWTVQEAALFALTVTAREVCARVKARTGGSSLINDRERTTEQLLQLIQQLCGPDPGQAAQSAAGRHALLAAGVARFVGAYAPAWSAKCSSEALLHIVSYLRFIVAGTPPAVVDAAKAIRSILVECSGTLWSDTNAAGQVLDRLREVMEAVLSTDKEEAMALVAEGCTRVIMQAQDKAVIHQCLESLIGPILQRGDASLNVIPTDGSVLTEQAAAAVDCLGRYLHVLRVIIRFCETGNSGSNPLTKLMVSVWPFLETVSQRVVPFEYVLDQVLSIHEQLLKNIPTAITPHFQQTMKYVVDVFEKTKSSSALGYMASAVEVFGSTSVDSFRDLLDHVAGFIFAYFSTEKRVEENPEIVRAFFEFNQRYILYCPAGLVGCPKFPLIVSCAVECLTACQGERESTRATLNFLAQLFGWRYLRISPECYSVIQSASQLLDEQVAQHGARIIQVSMATLVGGPQMLWPATTDCIFAIVCTTANWSVPEDIDSNVARQWLESAQPENGRPEVYQQVVSILLGLVHDGPKNKPKAKMLLADYCKIEQGEMAMDALLTYTLN